MVQKKGEIIKMRYVKHKRIISFLLLLALFVGMLPERSASAATEKKLSMYEASSKSVGTVSQFKNYAGYSHGKVFMNILDGRAVYCLNYGQSAHAGDTYELSNSIKTNLSATNKKRLAFCFAYGYSNTKQGNPDNSQRNKYVATQAMVWVITQNVFGNANNAKKAGKTICNSAPGASSAYSEFESLYSSIDSAMDSTVPDNTYSTTDKAEKKKNVVSMKWNAKNKRYEATVKLSKLSNFNISVQGDKIKTSVSGNKITFYSTSAVTDAKLCTFTSKKGKNVSSSTGYFWTKKPYQATYQEIGWESVKVDSVKSYLAIKTQGDKVGDAWVRKVDVDTGKGLANCEFKVYSKASCTETQQVGEDKYTSGTDGWAHLTNIPYTGNSQTFYVRETKAPAGYQLSNETLTIKVPSTKAESAGFVMKDDKPKNGEITINKNCEVLASYDKGSGADDEKGFLYKYDKRAGITFTLYKWNTTNDTIDTSFPGQTKTTGTAGTVTWSGLAAGTYRISEDSAPDDICRLTDWPTVVLSENASGEVEHKSITLDNDHKKIKLQLHKDVESSEDVESFAIQGATYGLYAGEDIYATGESAENGDEPILYADDLIETGVTNGLGNIEFEAALPYSGTFYMKEIEAPNGFLLSNEVKYIDTTSDTYTFINSPEEKDTITFYEKSPHGRLTVVKEDIDEKPLAGAVFDLYAAQDVYNFTAESAQGGGIKYKKGEKIATVTSGMDGHAEFDVDLPLGEYYALETKAPEGYIKKTDKIPFVVTWQGQDIETIRLVKAFTNGGQPVSISKTDITGEHELSGASMELYDMKGKLVDSWTSSASEAHIVELKPETQYRLHESLAPIGYQNASDVFFTTNADGKTQKVTMKDEVVMGKLKLYKTSSVNGKPIKGVKFKIYRGGKIVDTLTTDTKGYAESRKLPIGSFKNGAFEKAYTYTLQESKAAEGYLLDNTKHTFKFKYKDGKVPVVTKTYRLKNKPGEFALKVEKSTIRRTQCGDTYKYVIDTVSNQSSIDVEQFTLTDNLPPEVILQSLQTGTYSDRVSYNLYYKTNKKTKWTSWAKKLDSRTNTRLDVLDLKLGDGEYITAFQMRFGKVPARFKLETKPVYFTKVKHGLKKSTLLINHIKLTGRRFGIRKKSKDKTITRLFERELDVKMDALPKTGDNRPRGSATAICGGSFLMFAAAEYKRRRERGRKVKA